MSMNTEVGVEFDWTYRMRGAAPACCPLGTLQSMIGFRV